MSSSKKALEEAKRLVLISTALDLARDLASLLAVYDEDGKSLCHVVMAMHYLTPNAPMPEGMYALLKQHGFNPEVKVVSEEEMIALASENGCTCEACQALRAKSQAAKPSHLVTSGQNTVH